MIDPINDRMLFLDLETTGLDVSGCDVLEIAAVLTDNTGGIQFGEVDRIISAPQSVIDALEPEVADLHRDSGLLELLGSSHTVELDVAVEEINELIDTYLPDGANLYLNGSGVAEYDRPILSRLAPSLEQRLHYRSDDVSLVRNMLMKHGHDIGWTKGHFAPPRHRAMDDVQQSIQQWKWFKQHVVVK